MVSDIDRIDGLRILIVDDEPDILQTLEDLLPRCVLTKATTFEEGKEYLETKEFDLAILDIMGVNGLKLLTETVERGIPTVMLTAHAINPDTLMESIRKGAISYLPKEALTDLDNLLEQLLAAHEQGDPPWKLLFEKLGEYFNDRFGPDWREKDKEFWTEFSRTYQVGKGIQERLKHDERILGKGV